jgi:hypothetical protein
MYWQCAPELCHHWLPKMCQRSTASMYHLGSLLRGGVTPGDRLSSEEIHRRWDGEMFARATEQVVTDHRYRQTASTLQAHVERSGGVDEAVRLLDAVLP